MAAARDDSAAGSLLGTAVGDALGLACEGLSRRRCGGDTDTVAAIAGSIVGAGVGAAGIPPRYLDTLWDWPRGGGWIADAAREAVTAVDARRPRQSRFLPPLGLALRSLFFLAVVLAHGLRRLAPPY